MSKKFRDMGGEVYVEAEAVKASNRVFSVSLAACRVGAPVIRYDEHAEFQIERRGISKSGSKTLSLTPMSLRKRYPAFVF